MGRAEWFFWFFWCFVWEEKMDRLGNLFGAAARHHQTNQRNYQGELLAPLNKKWTKRNSLITGWTHRNSFFSWRRFFNPLNRKKTYAKAELVKLDPCPQGSGYFNLKWFPTTKIHIPICAQPSHVRFKTLMASSAVSQSHVTKPLLGTKTRAIRANLASRLFLGRWRSEIETNSFGGRRNRCNVATLN